MIFLRFDRKLFYILFLLLPLILNFFPKVEVGVFFFFFFFLIRFLNSNMNILINSQKNKINVIKISPE